MKYSLLTLLTSVTLVACASSASNPANDAGADADAGQDASEPDSGEPPDAGDGGEDSGGSTGGFPKRDASRPNVDENACEAPEIECGEIDLGMGIIIDCSDEFGNPTETEKLCEPYQSCVDNRCDCVSELESDDPPECEQANDCTPGGVNLGNCSDPVQYPGANWSCISRKCECTPTDKATACAGRECGSVSDGCGGSWQCGSGCGQGRVCEQTSGGATCECDAGFDTAAFCAGKCGKRVLNTCVIDCGTSAACSNCGGNDCSSGCNCQGELCGQTLQCCAPADPGQLCKDEACGAEVFDPCTGERVTCGCPAGQGCVDARYVRDSDASVCLPDNIANFVGTYLARNHSFTRGIGDVTRSMTLSLIETTTSADGSLVLMEDQSCIATTDNGDMGSGRARGTTFGYSYMPNEVNVIEIDGDNWIRQYARNATPEKSPVPIGWVSHMPSFCEQPPGAATDGVGLSNGRNKAWLVSDANPQGACTCPDPNAVCDASVLDPEGANDNGLSGRWADCRPKTDADCRVTDIDHNGRPGFSIGFEGGSLDGIAADLVSVADIQWAGEIHPNGSHRAISSEPVNPLQWSLGCTGQDLLCQLVNFATPVSCGFSYNQARLTKLVSPTELALECGDFYVPEVRDGNNAMARGFADIATSSFEPLFAQRGVVCDGGGPCPCTSNADCGPHPGTICHDDDPTSAGLAGHCWPLTSPRACEGAGSCPNGWECRSVDQACWPAGSEANTCGG